MSRPPVRSLSILVILALAACGKEGPKPPAAIVASSSLTVSAIAGAPVTTLPAVRVTDADGNGVANVAVTFAVTAGGGSGSGLNATSDASGVATVGGWTLGTTVGINTMTASATGLTGSPITFTATGTAGPAASMAASVGDNQSAIAGSAVPSAPAVKVVDANGNAVSGTVVTFAVASGGGSVSGATATSNAQGIAAVGGWILGTVAGANSLSASASGVTAVTFTATGTAGPASAVSIQAGNGQTAVAGAAVSVAPSVKVADANGNAVGGTTVNFAVATGGGSVTGGTATTNASGVATVTAWTLGTTAGANTLTATATGVTAAVTFSATGVAGPAASIGVNAGNNQSGAVGSTLGVAPSVKVVDANGNGVANASVSFAVVGGGGSVSAGTQSTNAQGVAAVGGWTLGTSAGTNTMNASTPAVAGAQVTFTATAAGPTQLGVITQPAGAVTGANLSTQPVVEVRTPAGVRVNASSATVTASVSSGSGTLTGTTAVNAVNGVATFTNLKITGTGATTLAFASSGLTTAVSNSFTVSSTANDPCAASPTLTVGAAATTGTLATTDCEFDDGSFVDFYKFTLTAARSIRISLSSATFDTFLLLANGDGSELIDYDDDGGGGSNSQLTLSLQAGTYLIAANSYEPAVTGAYTIEVADAGSDPCAGTPAAISVGQSATGSLASTDCRLTGGQYADRHQFTLAASTTIKVDLTSAAFDTYLYLTSATGTLILEDDNSGTGNNSYLTTTLAAGTYVLVASSLTAGSAGAYSLAIATTTNACTGTAASVSIGSNVSGSLANTDCQLQDGTYADRYQFTVANNNTDVTISLTSAAFDAYLDLVSSTGATVASDDDGAGGSNARITATLAAGTYTIYAGSYEVGTGAYQLSLSAPSTACAGSNTIAVGQTQTGALASTDCTLTDGSYADRWQLSLSASTTLSITMTSSALNAYLRLEDPSGTTVAQDDDGAGGTNAKLAGTFAAGTYVIYAGANAAGLTGAYSLAVASGGGTSAGPNLRVERAYLIQSTQNSSGNVPIIAGRDALLRVFVRADASNSATPQVRVRFYNASGSVVDTRTINAPGSSTPTTLTEGTLNSTWNVTIPGSVLQPGIKMLVDVDPNAAISESDENDNTWPASGTAGAVDVKTVAPLDVVLLRVALAGRTGNVTSSNLSQFMTDTRALWPLNTVNATIRASTYTSTLPGLQSSDGNGSWDTLLEDIAALREVEAPTKYYYGVVNVSYSSGIFGLGYIGYPAAIGIDFSTHGGETLAHELGHNFGRRHVNCGGTANADANYPYSGGFIGAYGYDSRTGTLIGPSAAKDLMTYCDPEWVSDYTYKAALNFIKSNPPAATGPSTKVESVLLWGRVDGDSVILNPAIELPAYPKPLPSRGDYRMSVRDASGATLLSFDFTPAEVADGAQTSRHFAFVVPKSALAGKGVGSVELMAPNRRRALLRARSADGSAASPAPAAPAVARGAAGTLEVRWNAAHHPIAVIRSAQTGEILTFARGGAAVVVTGDAAVDVSLSDGVRTSSFRVAPPR